MKKRNEEQYYATKGTVAILIDGGFFLKRLKYFSRGVPFTTDYVTKMVKILAVEHAKKLNQNIYRIFFYDCPPLDINLHNPISKKHIRLKDSQVYKFKLDLFAKLRAMRKVALRLGRLSLSPKSNWEISPSVQRELLSGVKNIKNLNPDKDIHPKLTQKQVDMKIGIDIASMTLKHQINTIVLVAGDGDFVPASKFARIEGIDFILDPMWAKINPDLNERIDGLMSVLFKRQKAS